MQCPNCGYDADDEAFFCPQCRFQFRDSEGARPIILCQEDDLFEDKPGTFSKKELKQLEIQLFQPALLLVLLVSLGTYIILSPLPLVPLTLSGLNIPLAGPVSFLTGLVVGILFFLLTRRSLKKYRFT